MAFSLTVSRWLIESALIRCIVDTGDKGEQADGSLKESFLAECHETHRRSLASSNAG